MSHDGYYWYFEYGKSWNEWEKDMVVVLRYYSSCASIVQFYEQQTYKLNTMLYDILSTSSIPQCTA